MFTAEYNKTVKQPQSRNIRKALLVYSTVYGVMTAIVKRKPEEFAGLL